MVIEFDDYSISPIYHTQILEIGHMKETRNNVPGPTE